MNQGTSSGGTRAESANAKTEEELDEEFDAQPALAVPALFVAEALCTKLPLAVRRGLGRLKIKTKPAYVLIDDLVNLDLLADTSRPTNGDAEMWCRRRQPPSHLDIYADAIALDELRAIVTGNDPKRKIALATIAVVETETEAEWAVLAIKRLRDTNTVARFEGSRRPPAALTLPTATLIGLGATTTDLAALPAADPALLAASGRIVDAWTEQERTEAKKPHRPAARITLTRAADVERKHVDWLWTTEDLSPFECGVTGPLIPLHGLTLLGGREQSAKSTFVWWLTSQITRGELPGHYFGRPRDVVIMATEETEPMIRMRLEVADADLDRVHFPAMHAKGDDMPLSISIKDDVEMLSEMLSSIEPGLVVLDPLKDFLGIVNTDREDEVRPALVPLLELTATHDAPVLGLIHLTKGQTGDFLTRISGSGAFKSVARVVFGLAHDEITGTRVLQQKKNNGAAIARGAFAGHVESVEITFDGRTEKVGKWVMDGNSTQGLDAVLAMQEQGGRPPTAAERAETFLLDHLDDGQPHAYEAIWKAANKLGIAERTLKRARSHINATSTRENVKGAGTMWQLPTGDDDDK